MTDQAETGVPALTGPVRTCIGCRQRAVDTDLLRVVVGLGRDTGTADSGASAVPDPRRRAPGRGAWVHRDLACVDLAIRRRAFGRALHASATIDPAPVRDYVAEVAAPHDTSRTPPAESRRR